MITRQTKLFYEVAGKFYPTLLEAQKVDLLAIIPAEWNDNPASPAIVSDWILANMQSVATILTTTPRSRNRKPRKDKGIPRKKLEAAP